MGVERAVTRWYVQRHTILNEIALLEAQLASPSTQTQDRTVEKSSFAHTTEQSDVADVTSQLAKAQAKLRSLGPCPRPMMG